MSNTEIRGSGRQSKPKGLTSQRAKGKDRKLITVDYDASRFTRKIKEKLYNRVWVRNGAVIEQEFNLLSFENLQFGFFDDFTARGWLHLESFKAESILTLCQEFMANIKHKPVTEKENPKLDFFKCWDAGFRTLLPESYLWVMTSEMAIGTGKTNDLPRMMFMALCAAYDSYDPRGSVPFIGLLMELFKKHGISILVNLTRTEPEKPIDRYSLTRSEGQRKKRKLEEGTSEQPSVGIPELQEAIANLRVDFDTCMTAHDEQFNSLEEQSGRSHYFAPRHKRHAHSDASKER
ncbi:hypothetical protein Acr_07g0016660 [Actinidia rufa]|uniref:Uncharacterized protein n=1 Tax=Actinidia rufa TaxID=165716 RepID=A0A7J0EYG8_9ERIC|nr:hypothetical protein Acr_07g0016660 [Actinidia rufa]